MNAWKEIFLHLKKEFDIYSPGQKEGKCNTPYIVLKDNGQNSMVNNKVGYKVMDLIFFIPLNKYSCIEDYKKKIKLSIKELNFIRPTGNESPIFIDEDRSAHTGSIEYIIHKRLN